MTNLSVVQFPGGNLADIPASLRNLADLIESGAACDANGFSDVEALVWCSLDARGNTQAGALGYNVDRHKAAGIMQHGMIELLVGEGHD